MTRLRRKSEVQAQQSQYGLEYRLHVPERALGIFVILQSLCSLIEGNAFVMKIYSNIFSGTP